MRAAFLVCLAACASDPVGSIRFAPTAPVWRVSDRTKISSEPASRDFFRNLYKVDAVLARRGVRALEARPEVHAKDVNALDEVPDSTWFTNRIGVRDLSIDEIRRGPNGDSPFDHKPWTITGAKIGGKSLGFTFTDATKRKFLLKFDAINIPEAETAAHIIMHRIMWAAGYNVPEDFLGYIDPHDLRVGDKARKDGLDEEKLRTALGTVHTRSDGTIRVLASLFIDGKIIGPYPQEGRRHDDPNDVIDHEDRRSLRGLRPLFAWLDHTDMKEDNSVDAFHDGYVTHYLIDFGKALGVMTVSEAVLSTGHRYEYDVPEALADLLSFGLRKHTWDDKKRPDLVGVGFYDIEHYDPVRWVPNLPYWPLVDADRFDQFWGAKLMMRFSRDKLAAIVDEAQLSDPRAARYLLDTLVARQRKTARFWFDQVAPLDRFTVKPRDTGAHLCFDDLTILYNLRPGSARYTVDVYDRDAKRVGATLSARAGVAGATCVDTPLAGDYTIVRIATHRDDGLDQPPVVVHLANDAKGRLLVVGLRRR